MSVPGVFKRDLRGRWVTRFAAERAWAESLRMAPARDAAHQLRRELHQRARYQVADINSPDQPAGFCEIIVFGKRVPGEMSYEEALALLERKTA